MKRTSKILLVAVIAIFSTVSVFAQLDPLPGDPLPGDPDPGIEVPLDGGLLIGLLASSGLVVSFIKRKKK
jgi:hypothetical protein